MNDRYILALFRGYGLEFWPLLLNLETQVMCYSPGHRIGHSVGDVLTKVARSFQRTIWFPSSLLADIQEGLRRRLQAIGI